MGALLKRFWADHRLATVISLALLFLGLLIKPWTLVLVLVVAFGGPLVGRLESLATSPVSKWRRSHWVGLALLLAAVLLALTGSSGGQGALILALLPVAWVLVTDRSILQGSKEDERSSLREPLTLSRGADEDKSSAQAEVKLDREAAAAEPPERLVGGELLAKIKELGDVGKSDLVRACGYFSQRPDGSERLNFTDFYEALLEAKGIKPPSSSTEDDDHDSSENSSANANSMDLLEDWNQLEDSEVVERLKTSLDVSAEILRALSSSDDWEVRQAVAWHENTPADIIEALAEDDDSDVRRATQERSLPKEWRTKSENEKVAALQSSNVPLEIIQELAASENWTLRQAVAWSPSTPESILATLKEDEDDDVKAAATEERQLPIDWRFLGTWDKVERLNTETLSPEILTILSKSRASDVRRAVVLNTSTPEAVLAQLAEDDDKSVQSGVRERQLPDAWKARDDDERIEALKEEAVPEDVLTILAQSGNWQIRQAVAFSPAASASVLQQLSSDEDTDVQSAVRERNLPEDWKGLDEDDKIERLKKGNVDEDVLTILAKSGRWSVRQAVARNQATPEAILNELALDDDDDVKSVAKKTLKKTSGGRYDSRSTLPWDELFAADTSEEGFERSPFENVPHITEELEPDEKLVLANLGVIEEECEEYLVRFSSDTKAKLPSDCVIRDEKYTAVFVRHGKARVVLGWKIPADRDALLEDLGKVWSEVKINGEKVFEDALNPTLTDYGSSSTSTSEIRILRADGGWFVIDVDEAEWDDKEETCLDEERGTGYYSNYFESREENPYQVAIVSRVGDGYVIEELPESNCSEFKEWIQERLESQPSAEGSDDTGEDEEHSIYIKTEPGGRISFGSLDRDQLSQLSEAIANQELSSELEDLRDNSYGTLNECDGVVNSGDEGDFGNEGSIVFSSDQPAIGPQIDDERGCFKDGVYVVLMRLSKCSIEFEFIAKGGFDSDEFEEVSVPVRLPAEIVHNLYGHPDFNIITGFRFRGEAIDEYEGEVEDRGYDDQYTFFAIRGGKTLVLYSNYNGEEEWCDPEEAKTVLSALL